VNEFPFWEYDRGAGLDGLPHPFTQPPRRDWEAREREVQRAREGVRLVLNGVELGRGRSANHDALIQQRVFDMFEYKREDVHRRFGFVLDAFKFGIPPHGGLSIGLDRLIAQLLA